MSSILVRDSLQILSHARVMLNNSSFTGYIISECCNIIVAHYQALVCRGCRCWPHNGIIFSFPRVVEKKIRNATGYFSCQSWPCMTVLFFHSLYNLIENTEKILFTMNHTFISELTTVATQIFTMSILPWTRQSSPTLPTLWLVFQDFMSRYVVEIRTLHFLFVSQIIFCTRGS